jgi:hypothetical protein
LRQVRTGGGGLDEDASRIQAVKHNS